MFLPSTVTFSPRALKRSLTCFAVLVSLDLRHGPGQLILGKSQADALGEDRHAEGAAAGDPLEHRGLDDVHQARQPDGIIARELLGDHREGGPCRLPDAEGQVAGRAAHGHHQVPPLGGHGIGHQVVDELNPHAPRGLEAEGRRAAR
jgi:hypothetical protein